MRYRSGLLNFSLFVLTLLVFNLHANAQTNSSKLAFRLLELESHTQWAAVTEAWTGLRDNWIAALQKTDPDISKGMLALENNLIPGAMQPSWQTARRPWQNQCREAANQAHVLARLLIELENNLQWASVDDGWKGLRAAWVAECQQIAANPEVKATPDYCKQLFELVDDLKKNGWKKWAGKGLRAKLWSFSADTIKTKEPLLGYAFRFTLAKQKGASEKTIPNAYSQYKQWLNSCLVNGWRHRSQTLYTDLFNGNNEIWQKEGITISLNFSYDSDTNGEHFLYIYIKME